MLTSGPEVRIPSESFLDPMAYGWCAGWPRIVAAMNDRRRGRGEHRVLAIVGPFSSEPFALGLRALLIDSGDFDVVTVDDPVVLTHDVAGHPAILIAEGADPAACQDYLDEHLVRSVVLFDPIGARAFIGLENPDWRGLAEVLRVAARDTRAATDRVRVVDPRTLPAVEAQNADAAVLFPLTEWLELSLGQALQRRASRDTPGVPGWSVAVSEALEMLVLYPQASTDAELVERLNAADIALAVTRTSLPGPVAHLAEAFALSALELRLLCLVLAPELDGRYATVIGVLQDDLTRRRPGLTLLAELMAQHEVGTWDLRRTIHASTSVMAQGLVQPAGSDGLPVDVGLAPSRAVVAHLLASSLDDAVVASDAALHRPSPEAATPLSAEEAQLARQLEQCVAEPEAMVHLIGGGPRKGWFPRLTAAIGLPLVVGDLGRVERRVAAVGDWGVLARLAGGGLMVLGTEALEPVDRNRVGARLTAIARGTRLVAADGAPSLDWAWWESATPMRAPTISSAQRAAWWSRAAAETGLALDDDDIQRLAATTQIDPERIQRSVVAAVRLGPRAGDSTVAAVQRAARELSPTPLPQGVRQIVPTYTWDDIVLSGARKELLQAIPLHVLQAGRVLEEWGFASRIPYGQGVAALFSGPSGTGKTMAAQIIAGALGVDLLQVDLSKTISKYIGETEKNLDAHLRRRRSAPDPCCSSTRPTPSSASAPRSGTPMTGMPTSRSPICCSGWSPFAAWPCSPPTSSRTSTTPSCARLRFVVEFALPNAAERERIWRKAFPALAPLAGDVDVALLAGRLQIPGGSIQNIALHAAFLAAATGGPITAAHLFAATRRELVKIGMLTAERSLDESGGAVMSADAIAQVTAVLQNRLAAAIGGPVYVGPPIAEDVGTRRLSLYLYQIVPNQALRNERHYVARAGDPDGPLVETQALPLDLRYLVSVFRSAGPGRHGRRRRARHARPGGAGPAPAALHRRRAGARPARADHPRALHGGGAEPDLGTVPASRRTGPSDGLPGEPGGGRARPAACGPCGAAAHVAAGSVHRTGAVMSRPPIAFEPTRTDVVTAVLIPVDGVTRRPVRSGLDALLWDPLRQVARPRRLVRNLSGHVVLLNEPADQDLTFRVDPAAAGYRGPLFITFNPARDGASMVVALERRPDRAFDDGTTLVRGSVVRSGGSGSPTQPMPVAGLTVTASPPAGSAGHQFPATTDERGVFALAVGLKLAATAEGPARFRRSCASRSRAFRYASSPVALDGGARPRLRRSRSTSTGTTTPPFTPSGPNRARTEGARGRDRTATAAAVGAAAGHAAAAVARPGGCHARQAASLEGRGREGEDGQGGKEADGNLDADKQHRLTAMLNLRGVDSEKASDAYKAAYTS